MPVHNRFLNILKNKWFRAVLNCQKHETTVPLHSFLAATGIIHSQTNPQPCPYHNWNHHCQAHKTFSLGPYIPISTLSQHSLPPKPTSTSPTTHSLFNSSALALLSSLLPSTGGISTPHNHQYQNQNQSTPFSYLHTNPPFIVIGICGPLD